MKAIAIERRARYTDVRGKRSTFSEFMRRTSERLCRRFPEDTRWSTVRGLFRQYPNLDVASRIAILRRTEEILTDSEKPAPPPPQPQAKASAKVSRKNGSPPTKKPNPSEAKAPGPKLGDAAPEPAPHKPAPQLTSTALEAPKPESKSGLKREEAPEKIDVQYVKGVGPKMAALLANIGSRGIKTVLDLLQHYPRQHLDFQNHQPIKALKPGNDVTIFGTIRSVGAYQSKRSNLSVVSVLINDGTGSITISKFIGGKSNRYLLERVKDSFPKGAQVMASGRVERDSYSGKLQLKNAEVEILGFLNDGEEGGSVESIHAGRLVPVYPLTEGVSLRTLRQIMHNALETFGNAVKDPLPTELAEKYNLIPVLDALWSMHFPSDFDSKEAGRRRLVFDELFLAQLELAMRRYRFKANHNALSLPVEGNLIKSFRENLPFKLTGAQERVFKEISSDLAAPSPMHRLVQGDVGSGKTVVAALSALVAIENGYQVAVMAPTEILAEQHYRQFQRWMTPLGLKVALLVGKQGVKERKQVGRELASGQVHIAVGTHALIQDDVEFNKLGFVIIDEQHRFGVKQRASLKAKGVNPELLTMTATPIPRTLALSLHGDLDVSEIDELPPGRKPIETKQFRPSEKGKLHAAIHEQILLGRQVYIVFPLIEESETLSAKAATAEYETLRTTVFAEKRVGLMHGKLKPQEKDEIMDRFRKHEFDILVATTVIEVGVDVPNASVMVIENADRFGLAQLHQLRGRVGRGADQSYCFLVTDSNSETVAQRLGIMCETNDGFVIAEKDLEIRGPGEFLGIRQSGLPDMLLADIVRDAKILEEARAAATELVRSDPQLQQFPLLSERLKTRQQNSTSADLIASG